MQFYNDSTLYFSVLPRDFVVCQLQKFCFDYRYLRRDFTIKLQNFGTIAFDLDGNLIVPDLEVSVYSGKNGVLLRKMDKNNFPNGCCVDKNGRIYAAGIGDIRAYEPRVKILNTGVVYFGLALDGNKLYACTLKGLMIVDTTTNNVIGNNIGGGPTLAVAVNPRTKQVVINKRRVIYVFESDGTFVRSFGNLKHPQQIAIDMHDNIYVVDLSELCHVFSSSGQPLGELPHKFKNARGVAISQHTVAIADQSGIHLFHG